MSRCVVLDTETTGLEVTQGHRLIEIGCVELQDFLPTGREFHCYIHPDRLIDPDAERVHGISLEFLKDKPRFHEPTVVDALLDFVGTDPIVAHNAAFDRDFLNHELRQINRPVLHPSRWIDSVTIARRKFPGSPVSLNALCKRFKISLDERDKHGALIDAQLLAAVYLELQGGRERKLDLQASGSSPFSDQQSDPVAALQHAPRPAALPSGIRDEERTAHQKLVAKLGSASVWSRFG